MHKNSDTVNPEQALAIRHGDGPMMVLAGPGSGKTFVITRRIAHLIREHHVSPAHILVITFTKAAALEMEERFLSLMGDEGAGVCFGTFHAVFYAMLRESLPGSATAILAESDKKRFLKEAFGCIPTVTCDDAAMEDVLSCISRLKNDALEPEAYDAGRGILEKEDFVRLYGEYHRILQEEGMLDFDDMVLKCHQLFVQRPEVLKIWQERYRYILIDEFQDINPQQYAVIRLLAEPRRNLFIVGDDDQSIYGFRSADPGIMLGFSDDYPSGGRIVLRNNYRSSEQIVKAALKLVEHNGKRFAKQLKAARSDEASLKACACENRSEEADAVVSLLKEAGRHMAYRDMALLFRTRSGARYYAHVLRAEGIPVFLKEEVGSVFSGTVGQDILAILAYAHGEHRRAHLLRFLNKPVRYIRRSLVTEEEAELAELIAKEGMSARNVADLKHLDAQLKELSELPIYAALCYIRKAMGYEAWMLAEAKRKGKDVQELSESFETICASARSCESYEQWLEEIAAFENGMKTEAKDEKRDAVHLMTMHGSKGLEFRLVVLPDVNEGNVPQKRSDSGDALEEERRIFYVAMTRAKERLFLFYLKKNTKLRQAPSRFLKELKA
ncbi:MAG: ATP-dependent helicase [Lachnospiraceae bacterium]|nr:ATP-dependent helicase [Lachnospiraceae bacterium]